MELTYASVAQRMCTLIQNSTSSPQGLGDTGPHPPYFIEVNQFYSRNRRGLGSV